VSGNDGSVWNLILYSNFKITNAPLLTYDRAGFGTSMIDTLQTDDPQFKSKASTCVSLKNSVSDKEIMLISFLWRISFDTFYAARHPKLVKGVVPIDVNHNYYEDGYIENARYTRQINSRMEEKTIKGRTTCPPLLLKL
jgi:hypothetical protein